MSFADRALYRVWQLWGSVIARPLAPENRAEVAAVLPLAALAFKGIIATSDPRLSCPTCLTRRKSATANECLSCDASREQIEHAVEHANKDRPVMGCRPCAEQAAGKAEYRADAREDR